MVAAPLMACGLEDHGKDSVVDDGGDDMVSGGGTLRYPRTMGDGVVPAVIEGSEDDDDGYGMVNGGGADVDWRMTTEMALVDGGDDVDGRR
jgi:hypothetical protein